MYPWVLLHVNEIRFVFDGESFVSIKAAVSVAAYLGESTNHFIK